jgi:hypothetical protein
MTKEENNILLKEKEFWRKFGYALREEDNILFKKMLNECRKEEYIKASDAMGEYHSSESLFMVLIFQQQKMISQLIDRLQNINKEYRKSNLGNS